MPRQRAHPRSHHRPAGVARGRSPPFGTKSRLESRNHRLTTSSRPHHSAPHPRGPPPRATRKAPATSRRCSTPSHTQARTGRTPSSPSRQFRAAVRSHPHLRRRQGIEHPSCQPHDRGNSRPFPPPAPGEARSSPRHRQPRRPWRRTSPPRPLRKSGPPQTSHTGAGHPRPCDSSQAVLGHDQSPRTARPQSRSIPLARGLLPCCPGT